MSSSSTCQGQLGQLGQQRVGLGQPGWLGGLQQRGRPDGGGQVGSIGGIGEGDTMVGKVTGIGCSGGLQATLVFFTEEDKGMSGCAEGWGAILPLVEGVAKHACLGEFGGDFSCQGGIRDRVASICCGLAALGEVDPELFDGCGRIPGFLEAGHVGSHCLIIQLTVGDLDVVKDFTWVKHGIAQFRVLEHTNGIVGKGFDHELLGGVDDCIVVVKFFTVGLVLAVGFGDLSSCGCSSMVGGIAGMNGINPGDSARDVGKFISRHGTA